MERFDGKTLLFLDGSAIAVPAVLRAKELGIKTIVANYYSEERSPAKKYADIALEVDFTNIEALLNICSEYKIDGMFQGWTDSHLPVYAELCKNMGWFCYGTKEQFEICANKDLFKKTCIKYNVPVAKDYILSYNNGILNGIDEVKFPVIVKPTDSSGSRGVYVCRNLDDLEKNYKKAWDISPSHSVAVEDYLVGQHVNIYYTISNGEIYLSAMADRYVDYHNRIGAPMPVCLIHPSDYLSDFEKNVNPSICNMFRGIGMKNGIAFVQGFRCNDGGFAIYEMGYRPNGGATYSLINACLGYNQLDMLIRFALTGDMGDEEKLKKQTPHYDRIAVNYVISTKNEAIKVGGVSGLDRISELPEVVDVVQKEYGGNTVSGERPHDVAFVLLVVDNLEQLDRVLKTIGECITIESVSGEVLPISKYDPLNKNVIGCYS